MFKNLKRTGAILLTLVCLNSAFVYGAEIEPEGESGDEITNAVAGLSVTLEQYYESLSEGQVDASVEMAITAIISEESANKLEVINQYQNLGIANVSGYLNVRETPGTDGKIIGKMVDGSACEIQEDAGDGWLKISSGSVTGYVSDEFISAGEDGYALALNNASLMAIVNADSLNVRQEPSTEAETTTKLSNEERYEVLEDLGDWVLIQIDSETGYVAKEFVTVQYALNEAVEFSPIDEKSALRSSLCEYALQFLGNPYVWGGESLTNGADCSGYTMKIFASYGYGLSHSSRAQANEGKEISYEEARPGDLLFFSNSGSRIDHVAIYLGNGQMVHASSETTGIILSKVTSRTMVKVVNIIGD